MRQTGKITGSKTTAYIAGAGFALIVGFSFLFVKTAVAVADPIVVIAYRFIFAFIAMAVTLPLVKKINLSKELLKSILLPALAYSGFIAFQAVGLKFATSVEGGILFAIIPIITMIIARIFLKERVNRLQTVFVSVSVTGVIALLLFSSGMVRFTGRGVDAAASSVIDVSILGIGILLFSSILLAASNTSVRHARRRFTSMEIAFVMMLTGAVIFAGAAILMGIQNGQLGTYVKLVLDVKFMASVAYLGILSTFATNFILNYIMGHMKAVEGTIFGNLSTAISIVAGALIMHEPVYAYHIICTTMIIVGVLGTNIASGELKNRKGASEDVS